MIAVLVVVLGMFRSRARNARTRGASRLHLRSGSGTRDSRSSGRDTGNWLATTMRVVGLPQAGDNINCRRVC